ncbi:hypothetical protein DERP_014325 [Dermatophagoides pteronyssinus]|uniref:Uncharacterized protein n=1 Tax=Dermatophagoides pteronyssinus TaxID=6956 RepID=A0ABQ8JWT5_DERPT|nr:hypothetical protein DERP_014325 [Dermatophagoides pteronyssinus]
MLISDYMIGLIFRRNNLAAFRNDNDISFRCRLSYLQTLSCLKCKLIDGIPRPYANAGTRLVASIKICAKDGDASGSKYGPVTQTSALIYAIASR